MIKIGDKVDDRYRIVSRVAKGGMADVYEASDLIKNKIVCLKVMRSDLLDDPLNFERFKKECEAASSLKHQNIVRIYGRGSIEGRPYMASEYIKGPTIRDKLKFHPMLSVAEASDIMLQLTDGIAYIHKHGLLHRDIKPDNLFYLPDGTVKITDFGISTLVGEKGIGGTIQGTIFYCAPEILMGQKAEIQSDIYSLGILYYELLTGNLPFEGKDPKEIAIKQIKRRMPEPSRIVPRIPKAIDKIIITACRKRPGERFQSAEEMHDAIEKALNEKEEEKERRGLLNRLFGFK